MLLSLFGVLSYYEFLVAYRPMADPNQIAALQERFRDIGSAAPPDGIMSYISDVPLEPGGLALRGAAQYAIAPRMIDPSPSANREWVLGNFFQSYDAERIARERGLRVVRDFGNGVVVFRTAHDIPGGGGR